MKQIVGNLFRLRRSRPMKPSGRWWYLGVLGVVLSGYPLVAPLPWLLAIEGREISIIFRASALVYFLAVGYYLVARGRIRLGMFGLGYLTFWCVYTARLIFEALTNSELQRPISEYFIFAYLVTLIPSLVCYVRFDRDEALAAGKIVWSMCFVAAGGVIAAYAAGAVENAGLTRFSLERLDPISVGHLGLTLFGVSVTLRSGLSRRVKWVALASAGIGLGLMGVAASRGPIVSFLVIAGILYLISVVGMFRTPAPKSIVAVAVISIVMVTAPIPILKYIEETHGFSVISRLNMTGSDDDHAFQIRMSLFRGAWDQFLESPVVGDGIEERATGFYPHNNVLEAFMATGVLGGSIIVMLYAVSFVNAVKLISSQSNHTWIGVVLLQYLVGTQFSGTLWFSDALFCLMAVAATSVRAARAVASRRAGSSRASRIPAYPPDLAGQFRRPQEGR